ncbi:NAD-dependent epimerase/dehydratase family protein [Naasia lichenicola]|nr:NAD-dependent epimerase/dehydratase family protein [Naasia lichenicola]
MTPSVLLIGGSSPLGRLIDAELTASGSDVLATSRVGEHSLDVTDRAGVDELFTSASFESVVYLASPTATDPGSSRAHLDALDHVLRRARDAATRRFVFVSSAAVYGTDERRPRSESSPLAGSTPYAMLKAGSEKLLVDAAGDEFLGISLRVFNVWGPGFRRSLINRLLDATDAPQLQVSESFVRDYIHGADVASAVGAALALMAPGPLTLNVGTGVGISNAALAGLAPPGSFLSAPVGPPTFSVSDPRRAQQVLGWRAAKSVADAFRAPTAMSDGGD